LIRKNYKGEFLKPNFLISTDIQQMYLIYF